MSERLKSRFDELYAEISSIESSIVTTKTSWGESTEIDEEASLTWRVKVKNLLVSSCGESSEHYKEFVKTRESGATPFRRMKAIFIAALDDYKGGHLMSIKNLIQADVFDSELEQADELLSNGYQLPAAVIAGVVLETALRDMCAQQNISIGKLDKMNSDLAKSGKYNKLTQKKITALADIRNSAAHGKINEFSELDVKGMIKEVKLFLAMHLS